MGSVLDASALLALMLREPGHAVVTEALSAGASACTVNIAEVAGRCARVGMTADAVRTLIGLIPVTWVDADMDLALRAGAMVVATRAAGLSLGDRFCLALAAREAAVAVTADTVWAGVSAAVGVKVRLIR